MYDLVIKYKNENGKFVSKKYPRIFDFTDEIERDGINNPMLNYKNIVVTFFEKITEPFDTIKDLYEHCIDIMK